MDEYSPWGSADDPPPARLPDPLPSLDSVAVSSPRLEEGSSTGWQDDGGGWGSAVDAYAGGGYAGGSGSGRGFGGGGMEETTEDLDGGEVDHSAPNSPITDWQPQPAPELTTFSSSTNFPSAYSELTSPAAGESSYSPPLGTTHRSPVQSASLSPPPSRPATPPPPTRTDDGWGSHGTEPELPPLSSLALDSGSGSRFDRDEDWAPKEIEDELPPAMPTINDLFSSARVTNRVDEEEGWGGANEVPAWNARRGEEPSAESGRPDNDDRGWPADAIEEAKARTPEPEPESEPESAESEAPEEDEGRFKEENENKSETTPPAAAPAAPTGPSLFSKLRLGLSKTAQKSAEAAQAAEQALAAARSTRPSNPNAMSSIQGLSDWEAHSALPPPPSAPEAEQEAAEPKHAQPEAQGGWWKRRATGSARSSSEIGRDPSQGGTTASGSRTASPANADGPPGKLRSMLGRFGRTASDGQDGEDDLPPEWQPRNLDEARRPKQREEYVVEDDLDDFFGGSAPADPNAGRQAQPQARPYDDGFGGLMGSFSAAPAARKVPVAVKPRVATLLDPFDPFADEDQIGSPALAPVAAPFRTLSGSTIPRMTSPPIQVTSRPITPLAPPPASASGPVHALPSQVASFARPPPSLASPTVAPLAQPAPATDAFDDFFASATKTAAPRTGGATVPDLAAPSAAARAPAPALAAPLVPRPFITPPISPPRRSPMGPATVTSVPVPHRRAPLGAVRAPLEAPAAQIPAPPPPSASPVGFVPPPPRPSQPLGKGFGFLPPPPPPGTGVRSMTPPVGAGAGKPAGAVQPAAKPQPKKSGGPLDLDDLSFFES